MAIDTRRVLEAALAAAIKEATPPPKRKKKRRLSTGRALLLGAGLATAGRIAAGPKAREMVGRVRQRITDVDWLGDGSPDDIDDYDEELDAEGEDEFDEGDEFDEDEEFDEDDEAEEDGEAEDDEADDESLEAERAD